MEDIANVKVLDKADRLAGQLVLVYVCCGGPFGRGMLEMVLEIKLGGCCSIVYISKKVAVIEKSIKGSQFEV